MFPSPLHPFLWLKFQLRSSKSYSFSIGIRSICLDLECFSRFANLSSLLGVAAAGLENEFEVLLSFVGYDALTVSVHSHYYFNLQAAPIIESN